MARALMIYNNSCLCCGKIHEAMVKIGSMAFCLACFHKEFFSDPTVYNTETAEVNIDSEVYQKWLEKYKKVCAAL
jgi:hypothetical protein